MPQLVKIFREAEGVSGSLQATCNLHYIGEAQLDALRPQFAEVTKILLELKKSFKTKI